MAKLEELPRVPIIIDEQGRLTVPKPLRAAFGLPEGQKYPLWVEPYPDLENCKGLLIRK